MKRTTALLLLLFMLPMTKAQMIRCIRCQNPDLTYEELVRLSPAALRVLLPAAL